jgi:hypothetical protein
VTAPDGAQLARDCCVAALRGKWAAGRVVVCGGCFLPYTAVSVFHRGAEVPSWWTGLR